MGIASAIVAGWLREESDAQVVSAARCAVTLRSGRSITSSHYIASTNHSV